MHMRRKSTRAGRDHRIFTQTARAMKKINVSPRLMRGGIRL